jgi:hypothetical protein
VHNRLLELRKDECWIVRPGRREPEKGIDPRLALPDLGKEPDRHTPFFTHGLNTFPCCSLDLSVEGHGLRAFDLEIRIDR